MGAQEMQLRGHLWPVVSVAFAFAICLHGGWLGSRQLIHAQFDPQKMPVAAVTFLQKEFAGKQPSTEPVFSTDAWGGYLIYRMYPERKVVVDDRHDLYGSGRIRQYLILTQAEPGWRRRAGRVADSDGALAHRLDASQSAARTSAGLAGGL